MSQDVPKAKTTRISKMLAKRTNVTGQLLLWKNQLLVIVFESRDEEETQRWW